MGAKLVADWSRGRIAALEAENAELKKTIKTLRAKYECPFKHGDRVKFKKPGPNRTKQAGIIRGRPRAGSTTAYVVWPDGWAGHAFLDELRKIQDDEE